MGLLDPERYPMRFAVITTVAGGLVLFAIERALDSASPVVRVPLWFMLAGVSVLVTVGLALVRQYRNGHGAKRVFLVISAFSQKHYVAELIRDLHHVLDQRGYELVVKIPNRDYSSTSQIHHLQRILRRRGDYVGGFVMPAEVNSIRSDLVEFCARAALPVVFIDDEPFDAESDYPANTAFVGYSAGQIGEYAAEWVVGYLNRCQEATPAVLIVTGYGCELRQRRFKEVLMAHAGSARIIEDTAKFDRICARDVVSKHLNHFRVTGRTLHVIYCTNDEMALGAVDALLCFGPHQANPETVVVGVDGTPQARALIETSQTPLRATVVQDSYRVAETGVDLLERRLRKQRTATRTLLPAMMYARE